MRRIGGLWASVASFANLRRRVVLHAVARVVKDRRVLDLLRRIVEHGGHAGRGLPIGHLTSQWLANVALGRLDRFVVHELRVGSYARYMDDFVLFDADRVRLRAAHREIAAFLERELGLALKPTATLLAPVRMGVPFLGWRSFAGLRRLRPANRRRSLRRLRQRLFDYRGGRLDEARLADCVRAVMAHVASGDTLQLRRQWCRALAAKGPADARGPPR